MMIAVEQDEGGSDFCKYAVKIPPVNRKELWEIKNT